MDKKTLYSILLALFVSLSAPSSVCANETITIIEEEDETIKEVKEKAKKWGKTILEGFEKIDEKIHEMVVEPSYEVPLFDHNSLWLVTDIPNVDPQDARNYFFVFNKIRFLRSTAFYDKNGNKFLKNDGTAVRKYEQEEYTSVSTLGKNFVIRTDYNLIDQTFISNFADFNIDYLWEEETPLEYGRIINISDFIPEDMQKDKYTENDLKAILDVLNNCDYVLTSKSFNLEKKINSIVEFFLCYKKTTLLSCCLLFL